MDLCEFEVYKLNSRIVGRPCLKNREQGEEKEELLKDYTNAVLCGTRKSVISAHPSLLAFIWEGPKGNFTINYTKEKHDLKEKIFLRHGFVYTLDFEFRLLLLWLCLCDYWD